jgi:hypothetical protein
MSAVAFIYDQLARSGLLPSDISSAILHGSLPSLQELVAALVVAAQDCEAMTRNSVESTWFERRLATQCLVIAFLSALAIHHPREE